MTSYSLLLEMMIVSGVWLCLAILQRDPSTPGRRTFVLVILAWMAWCFGALAGARDLISQPAAAHLRLLGSLTIAPLWLGVAAHTARLEIARRMPWFPVPLVAPGACILCLLFSDTWGGLFLVTSADGTQIRGPLWDVMLVYRFALALLGTGIFVAAAVRWSRPGRRTQSVAIGAAPFVTLVGSGLYFGHVWRSSVDPTPLLVGATLFLLHRGIFAGGLLQALPISQHALVRQLPLGLVLTDRGGVVLDVNPVAEQRLGLSASEAIGRNFDAVIDAADADLRFEITPVMSAGSEVGQVVLLDRSEKREPAARDLVAKALLRDGPSPGG